MERLASGVWPTMITPFTANGAEIDWTNLKALTNWYIESGVAGLFTVCLSSEMYELSPQERLLLAERVRGFSAGRVPVVAGGVFRDCGTPDDQAEFVRQMAQHCDAVVVVVNQLALADEDDEVWLSRAQHLLDRTGDIPLGLYESPLPYHRTLSPSMIEWAASTKRFLFHKDTCQNKTTVMEKMQAARRASSSFAFFTAKAVFTSMCLASGADGFSGIAANFFPFLYVWLCDNYASRTEKLIRRVQQFLTLADFTLRYKYPMSAKVYHRLFHGLPVEDTIRITSPSLATPLEERDVTKLRQMHSELLSLCSELAISCPASGGGLLSRACSM